MWHHALRRPNPHSLLDKDEHHDPHRDDGSEVEESRRFARRALPSRAWLVAPATLFLFIGLGFDPVWWRFLVCFGLLLLGPLVIVNWNNPVGNRSAWLKTLYAAAFGSYVLTLFI